MVFLCDRRNIVEDRLETVDKFIGQRLQPVESMAGVSESG